ncbi:CBS domain-containing protein [Aromatoleum buckelii]|uniref:CBS domain-containing protein n=1 Tax=Aromatoleum buckelii TaxID=200254 RepID=A0ABX1N341_9RHOO|nr:CBS domain-containing protein [Aromatoleum buckelii]MCK0513183.1 CBS domain-containing protein [Aromatoleum buckelii]
MLVRNWMQKNPITVTSGTLVSEAKRILAEKNLHALPVVDNGRLRGLVTRASCLRASDHVARTQDPNEFDYFVNRLRVRDVMVRNPVTVSPDDTIEHCLLIGQELGHAQLPVVDEEEVVGRVVGVISANEVFKLSAQFLGAFERWAGVTLAPIEIGHGTLGRITAVAEQAGAVVYAVYPIADICLTQGNSDREKRVVLRFQHDDMVQVVLALRSAGYRVSEESQEVQSKKRKK